MAPRDFKERPARNASPSRQPRRHAVPARWPWFGAGMCVGALVTAAIFVYEPRGPATPGASARLIAPSAPSEAPRFEFYTLLPEKEIAIPEAELDRPLPAPRSAPPTPDTAGAASDQPPAPSAQTPADAVRYLLQVGSFRRLEDADRLKARVAFMGLHSSIQTVSIDGVETWHRVRVGPFTGRDELDHARATLKQNQLESMALRLK